MSVYILGAIAALFRDVEAVVIASDFVRPPAQHDPKSQLLGFVLNLASRPGRWMNIQRDWAAVHSVRLVRQDAVPHYTAPGGTHTINGATASHIKVVEEAFAANPELQVMLVLEDDALPRPNFDEIFPHVYEYAQSCLEDWHIINIGSSRALPSTLQSEKDDRTPTFQWRSPHLMRVNVWSAAHAILVNRRALPWYARLKDEFVKSDVKAPEACIDWVLSHQSDLITLATIPLLVTQRPGYSDLLMRAADYDAQFYISEVVMHAAMDALQKNSQWPALQLYSNQRSTQFDATEFFGWGTQKFLKKATS